MAETARDWTPDSGLHWHPAQNLVQHGGFWVACGHEVIVAVVADEGVMISKRVTSVETLFQMMP